MTASIGTTEHIAGMASAKTNMWRIPVPDLQLIATLLEVSGGAVNVDYLSREIAEKRGESKETYYARVHAEGRKMIRQRLALPADSVIEYELLQVKRMCYFFFLFAKPRQDEDLLSELVAAQVPLPRLAQALIGLRVKLDLLAQLDMDYAIQKVHHNGALYLGSDVYPSKKEGHALVDTFEARFYYSDQGELISTMHNRTFFAAKAAVLQAPLADTVMTVHTSRGIYVATEKADARQYGRKKFMRFQSGYASCQNHAHTLVARCVERLFQRLGIDAIQETFHATAVWNEFVTADNPTPGARTVVVDNYGTYASDEIKNAVYAQLRGTFGACEIVPATSVGSYVSLSESVNYLFLNRKQGGRNGSSIVDAATGTRYNTFWQAFKANMANDGGQLDLYTRLKIAHFARKRPVVMQGIDLPESLQAATDAPVTAYTSPGVPQILGNVRFDNVERFQEQGDCLRKLTAPDDNPLPYYVNPRQDQQYHHVFLQEAPPGLRYFVSPKGNPQSVFATQCRTYNILVWDKQGDLVRPFDEPVTRMFLRSFTDDIVLNGQVSKSSLLLKAAKLYLQN